MISIFILQASLECTAEGEVQYWFLHGKGEAIDAATDGNEIFMNNNGSLYFRVSDYGTSQIVNIY